MATMAAGESPQRRPQNRNIEEVIRPNFVIGDCTTSRGGHPTEVSSSFQQKQGKESCTLPIENSHPIVTPAYNVSGNELHRIESEQSKSWVAKEQGNSSDLRLVHSNQNKSLNLIIILLELIDLNFHPILPKRIKHNQAKCEVSINLTAYEITMKQGLHVVLYVKEEIIRDLAAFCKYTLIRKFSTTMPKVDLIRNNFILQT
ncbi:hypothetical protein H5410_027311 [Solanum commersonii]|uniref:Uncharacterized protein n=1 Tax=Solanum commersonii TaxID=4109 RepID=A0A9J5YYR4_SOLCO|nr:hypothetical protein H5410_027311 [Solanum commersonii]